MENQAFTDSKISKAEGIILTSDGGTCSTIKIIPKNNKKVKLYAYLATTYVDPVKKTPYTVETLRGSTLLPQTGNSFDFDWAGPGSTYRIFVKEVQPDGKEVDVSASQATTIQFPKLKQFCLPSTTNNYGELKMNGQTAGLYNL